ncbi:hypothetical protein MAMT_02226 [Methylacidimicrobium tartarophylax]|uniref:Uncharacterized protein n=1 Tax=Methylacidimicrobium tartarophylax TaxID=1041768 RepID=A0A5E6MGW5_9BACT|nr:hypothetical protein MAMT_02226 [Methylacidimicrobium tartarophylax]
MRSMWRFLMDGDERKGRYVDASMHQVREEPGFFLYSFALRVWVQG